MAPSTDRPTWLHSERFLARSVARPVNRFLHIEASGGVLLAGAALIALVWANSPWSAAYRDLWATDLTLDLAGHAITQDLRHWINDGLMTLFFFVVGLEIKQELTNGQLTSPRDAAVPAAGALGGMVVPALLYVAFNLGGAGSAGWGIPMATDVGVRSRGARPARQPRAGGAEGAATGYRHRRRHRRHHRHRRLLLRRARRPLAHRRAGAGLLFVALLRRVKVRYLPVYVVLGSGIWLATFESGVHATIAGVALGLLAPARSFLPEVDADRIASTLSTDQHVTAAEVRDISFRLRESIPVTERLQGFLTRGRATSSCRCSPSPTPASPSLGTRSATPPARRSRSA